MLNRKAQSARRGFTLVELMIVIVIVGVLSAVAYQTAGTKIGWSNHRLDASQGQILRCKYDNEDPNAPTGGANVSNGNIWMQPAV